MQSRLDFPGEGGTTGALIRSIAWSRTPLGSIEGWSPALRTTVATALRSRLPTRIFWGPRFIELHNDAALAAYGGDRQGLGRPGPEAWPDVWATLEPVIERVYRGAGNSVHEDLLSLVESKGILEERHFSLAFGPVPDETIEGSGIGGVLVVARDTTELVQQERQWLTLRRLGAVPAEARTRWQAGRAATSILGENPDDVPFALLYLADPSGSHARLACWAGFADPVPPTIPRTVALTAVSGGQRDWGVAQVLTGNEVVVLGDLAEGFGRLPCGRWSEPPRTALTLPLSSPEDQRTFGALVVGVSPHRPLDQRYRSFFELAASQIAIAVRAGAERARRENDAANLYPSVGDEPPRWSGAPVPAYGSLEPAPSGSLEPAPSGARRPRVLVADDDSDMRDCLARILGVRWAVESVADGQAALEAARTRLPDLVLADVLMPGLTGVELLKALRADPRTRQIPVLLVSALGAEDARIAGLEAGAADYIIKPFSGRELVARVATQLEMRALRTTLFEQRVLLDQLFRSTPIPVAAVSGNDLVFDMANPAFVHVVGDRNVVGKSLLEALPELRGQRVEERLLNVLHTGVPYVGVEEMIRVDRRGTGEADESYWTYIFSRLPSACGPTEQIIGIGSDVTEPVLARRRLEQLARDADAANRAKDEFLAVLGHELRNPLSPIVTSLELMRLRGLETRELSVIERQVNHLARLVNDLLDVSRITRGKIELRKERLELAGVVRQAVETVSPLLEQRCQRLDLDVADEGLLVEADPGRLAQVVSNLLTNASKYSEPRSRIEIAARREGDRLILGVRDEGIGIAPDMADRIFEQFVQQSQSLDRSRGGLGLGLAIVRSLVALHGGKVSARSEGPGRGSEFLVELPVASSAEQATPAPSLLPAAAERGSAAVSDRTRILVVDDNEDLAASEAEILSEMGYDVKIAHDGQAALSAAQSFKPRVCLLDIGLPVMDGYEVARRLRSTPEVPHDLRIIAISGYGQDADRRRSGDAGFDGHLVKPVTFEQLTRAVGPGPGPGPGSSTPAAWPR